MIFEQRLEEAQFVHCCIPSPQNRAKYRIAI